MAVKRTDKPKGSTKVMIVSKLRETHELYDKNYTEWRFLLGCYEGTKELVRLGYVERNERETVTNYERRVKEAYNFGYTKSVIDLFNFYLFKKPVKRTLDKLLKDPQWEMFVKDCDLYGNAFDDFLTEMGRYASIMGYMGLLVDKSSEALETVADEIAEEVYPYIAAYFPTAILDWEFRRDKHNRPYLHYLKLLDDVGADEEEGEGETYRLWWRDHFEIWELPEVNEQTGKAADDAEAKLVKKGGNPLGVIPFVWLYNLRGTKKPIGVSDVHEVGRIDVSILRNLSQGEEIITYAAFPMMRKPMQEAKPDGLTPPAGEDDVGVTAVLEFDPEHPESKPDWLNAAVAEPIAAILDWIVRKVSEIYRATNVGGMASMEVSDAPKSGVALQAEFQLLNSNLVRKAVNLEKAERQVINYWLLWQQNVEWLVNVIIERSRTYDVEQLATDLENALTSKSLIKSEIFVKAIQKAIARQMLPGYTDDQMKEIDDEIDASKPFEPPAIPPAPAAFGGKGEGEEEEE